MTAILALDLARVTGWAFWKPGMSQPRYGILKLKGGAGEIGTALVSLRYWMVPFMAENGCDVGLFEKPILRRFGKGQTSLATARWLYSLCGEAEANFVSGGADAMETDHGTFMAHWVGDGTMKRDEGKVYSVKAARFRGFTTRDDNCADALGILDEFCCRHRIKVPWECRPCPKPSFLDLAATGKIIGGA